MNTPKLFILLCIAYASTQLANAQTAFWTGAAAIANVNSNWSNANNWSPSSVPGPSSSVIFSNDPTAQSASPFSAVGAGIGGFSPANFNNVVDGSFAGAIDTLTYTNIGTYQSTLLANGVTLSITNSLTTGSSSTAFTATAAVFATIAGSNSTLNVNTTNGTVLVSLGGAAGAQATLDLSGLATLNASVSRFLVGVGGSAEGLTTVNYPSGVLYLARTNTITASVAVTGTETSNTGATDVSLDVGDSDSNAGALSYLYLGQTNGIFADAIGVGRQKDSGTMEFNPNLAANGITPSVYFRGASASAVAFWSMGDSVANTGTSALPTGTADFTSASGGSEGYVNALVNTMYVGRAGGGTAGTCVGLLSFDNGIFNVGTLYAGYQAVSAAKTGSGTVNVGTNATLGVGATLSVSTNLNLAITSGAFTAAAGTLNINGGSVFANTITVGAGVSTISLNSGILVVTDTLASAASPLSSLTVDGGATLQFALAYAVANSTTNAEVQSLSSSDNHGIINLSSLPNIPGYPSKFPLLHYSSSGSGVAFSMGTLPSSFRGYVSNDNSSTIWVVITNGPAVPSVKWGGYVNNQWDTNTLNWTNTAIVGTVKFQNLNIATFDDTANTQNVNLLDVVTPTAWIVTNNVHNYTFSGVGQVTGPGGLFMNGTAMTRVTDSGGDNFSGGITVNFGTLVLDSVSSTISGGLNIASGATAQIGNNDANGSLPTGPISDNGTLIFDQTINNLVSSGIGGGGALTQNGSGELTLSGVNGYTGTTTVTAGGLALTNSGSIADSAQVNVTGATLDVFGVSGVTTLNGLSLSSATLNVAVGYVETNLTVTSLSMSGANTINVESLPPISQYPATVPLLYSSGGMSGFGNLHLGSLPTGTPANMGTISQSGDGDSVLLTLTQGPTNARPYVVWVGTDSQNTARLYLSSLRASRAKRHYPLSFSQQR